MEVPNANIRSLSYYIAETQARCAKCGRDARVLALAVPPNHKMRVDGEWQNVEANAVIFHISELQHSVSRPLLERSPQFRLEGGQDPSNSRWTNHCEHCGEPFSDEELHCEPGGFMPSDAREAEGISLTHIAQGFSACAAGYALEPEFFALTRRR